MSMLQVIKTATGGLLLLIAQQAFAAPQDLPVKTISVPAYNMITDTLQAIDPTKDGKLTDFAMQQICALARGDRTQKDVNSILKEKGIDADKLPKTGNTVSLLVNGDKEQQQMVCAVYLANSVFRPVDNSVYFSKKNVSKEEKTESGWSFWKSDKKKEIKSQDQQVVFNRSLFVKDAQIKMAIVQATAQMYAVIAENIQNDKGKYWADYQQHIASIVYNYAPEYLRKISVFYKNRAEKALTPLNVSLNSYTVANNVGDVLTQQAGNVNFTAKGVLWFGNGKILGKDYFSNVIAIQPENLLTPAQNGANKDETGKPAGYKEKNSKK
ncbi:hypothetical protein [Enterobacter cloacae]|uniref:hypothetical protein n=1 Tax=Enterobacter cloacae TaxID=550 RepID=UPI00331575B0